MHCLTALEAGRSPSKSWLWQNSVSRLPLCKSASYLCCSLPCRCITLISSFIFTPRSPCLLPNSPLSQGISHSGYGGAHLTPAWSHLNALHSRWLSFHRKSHSEIVGMRFNCECVDLHFMEPMAPCCLGCLVTTDPCLPEYWKYYFL